MIIKWIIALMAFGVGYWCSIIGVGKKCVGLIVIGAICLSLSCSLFLSTGRDRGREQSIREYLNGELQIDTLCLAPSGKILEVKLKYK